jgi:hypothetical protein
LVIWRIELDKTENYGAAKICDLKIWKRLPGSSQPNHIAILKKTVTCISTNEQGGKNKFLVA